MDASLGSAKSTLVKSGTADIGFIQFLPLADYHASMVASPCASRNSRARSLQVLSPSADQAVYMRDPSAKRPTLSAAARWAPLARFIVAEERLGRWAEQRPATHFAYEFVRFGIKQAWACLFGATMVVVIAATYLWYPHDAWLARYDFIFLAALAIQAGMLVFRLETLEEAKVILIFHIVG